MFDDKSRKFKNHNLGTIEIDSYKPYVGEKAIEDLKWLAEPLENKIWANINSTFIGGGVAEILQSLIPAAKGLGINSQWFILEGSDQFFKITKTLHNLLQGEPQKLRLRDIFDYLNNVESNLENTAIAGDMVVIHDPHPLSAILSNKVYGHMLWRCHIDTSRADEMIWKLLLPYINLFDGAIFTAPEYLHQDLNLPAYNLMPAIDPSKEKNKLYTREKATVILSSLLEQNEIDPDRPIVLSVCRYDTQKNHRGIIKVFRELKQLDRKKSLSPQLVMIGNTAKHDLEGEQLFQDLKEMNQDPDIHLLINLDNNDQNIAAFMSLSSCFVHLPTNEGFGLSISEAMWHGLPVVASKVGGIIHQVVDQKNGYLVSGNDIKSAANHIFDILNNADLKSSLGKEGRKHVINNFLLPRLLKQYLLLFRYYCEIDNKLPDFRINQLTYKEIKQALYSREHWPFTTTELKNKLEKIIN